MVGVVYINVMFNNMMVIIIDIKGDMLCWVSVGICGFKGSWKSIFYVV